MADMKHGQGVFQWHNGNRYEGEYKNDFRDGYGEMYWNDSSHYKGQWERGLRSGLGHHVLSNGKKRIGQFIADKFVGVIKKESEV